MTQGPLASADAEGNVYPYPREGYTRCVAFSDTHCKTHTLPTPPGDVLLHAGDFSMTGLYKEVEGFAQWLEQVGETYPLRIVIAGNHDLPFDKTLESDGGTYYDRAWERFHRLDGKQDQDAVRGLVSGEEAEEKGIVYLEDESIVLFPDLTWKRVEDPGPEGEEESGEGWVVCGSPWSPAFYDWAFNADTGPHIRGIWKRVIPKNVDVLITHGPPAGFGGKTVTGHEAGCQDLMDLMATGTISPMVHVYGHIHEGAGVYVEESSNPDDSVVDTLFVNASNCTLRYKPNNPPIVFDLPHPSTSSST